jgi:hypothetical protein
MKQNHHQVTKKSSPTTTSPQAKTAHIIPEKRPASLPEALPPFDPNCSNPNCLCLFDRDANKVVAKVPLSEEDLISLRLCAVKRGLRPAQFIADELRRSLLGSIREGMAGDPAAASASPSQPPSELPVVRTGHDRLTAIIEEAVIVMELLSEKAWEAVDQENEDQRRRGNGLAWLASRVSDDLGKEMDLAMQEWTQALLANSRNAQRRAA